MVADRSHLGRELAARYQIEELLATGSVCQVYRGADVILRRQVAIKVVPAEAIPAYRRALVLTAQLTHPAIIATFDAIELDGYLFLVQEYVQTRPFRTYLRNGLPVERAADLAGQIARALAYAHAHGVVHGDLTPASLLVDRRAALRVNNFCLPPDEAYFTEANAALESGLGAVQTQDAAGDVRAVGLLLWQALTDEKSNGSTRAFRPDVLESARTLVRRCLATEESGAIRDAETLVLALEALGGELSRARPAVSEDTPPALRVAREMIAHEAPWSLGDTLGVAAPAWEDAPSRATQPSGADPSAATVPTAQPTTHPVGREGRPTAGPARLALPSRPIGSGRPAGPASRLPHTAPPVWAAPNERRPSIPPARVTREQSGGISLALVLAAGIVLFLLFFVIGIITVRP